MTLQDEIYQTVLRAKCTSACWAVDIINREKYGDEIKCCELRLILLVKWIEILENYYCKNFDGDSGTITPEFACMTVAEIEEFLGKVKIFIKQS